MKNLGIFLFIFSLIYLFFMVPQIGSDVQTFVILDKDFNTDNAKLYPYLIGIIIFLISILMIIKGLIIKEKPQVSNSSRIYLHKAKDVGILIVISLIYIILLEPLGFFIMTPVCLAVFSWFFGLRKWSGFILEPILITIIVYVGFELLMKVQLPKGILEWIFY